jgi:hypothetical protein
MNNKLNRKNGISIGLVNPAGGEIEEYKHALYV